MTQAGQRSTASPGSKRGAFSGSWPAAPDLRQRRSERYTGSSAERELTASATLDEWLGAVKRHMDAHLESFFADKRWQAAYLSEPSVELVDALARYTLRGGKRSRPAFLLASYAAVSDDQGIGMLFDACASLELLHTYLLVHDDWMDQDDRRRGGPTLHREFGDRSGNAHLGASLAVLAGDLACGFAAELLSGIEVPSDRRMGALDIFWGMHQDVVWGQQLDLMNHRDAALIERLKTGAYTVRGPVLLGAVLGGAEVEQYSALECFAEPAGQVFQVSDDLLGTFGDPAVTGKPVGNDLRAGKYTPIVEEAERRLSAADWDRFNRVFGQLEADQDSVQAAIQLLERAGVRKAVEERLETLSAEAAGALDVGALRSRGRERLRALVHKIARRKR